VRRTLALPAGHREGVARSASAVPGGAGVAKLEAVSPLILQKGPNTMNNEMVEQVRRKMEEKDTEELLAIWRKNDKEEWTEEAFEAICQILSARGESLPLQREEDNIDLEKEHQVQSPKSASYTPSEREATKSNGEAKQPPSKSTSKILGMEMEFEKPLFKENEYILFVLGVLVLGGLLLLPLIWNLWFWISWVDEIPWSLGASVAFLIAFRRNGALYKGGFIVSLIAQIAIFWWFSSEQSEEYLLKAMVLWYIAYWLCGSIGIAIGRPFHRQAG